MKKSQLTDKGFGLYMLKFLSFFCIAYYGTIGLIGICTPGGYYVPFVQKYLDYVSLLRSLLLHSTKAMLSLFGYATYMPDIFSLRMRGGRGVHIGYDCIGYGVLIFWWAFVFANKGNWKNKILWIFGGSLLIWSINVIRVSMLLISINENRPLPFNLDHHTLFNIAAYAMIFVLIYFFDRMQRLSSHY